MNKQDKKEIMNLIKYKKMLGGRRMSKTCEQCINCMYVEHGDMYCDLTVDTKNNEVKWVYDEYCPTEDYMWCNGKKFESI